MKFRSLTTAIVIGISLSLMPLKVNFSIKDEESRNGNIKAKISTNDANAMVVTAFVANWWQKYIMDVVLMETVKVAVENELHERWEKYKKQALRQLSNSVKNIEGFLWSEFLCSFRDINIDLGSFQITQEWELKGRCTTTKVGFDIRDELKWKIQTANLVSDFISKMYEGYMGNDDFTLYDAWASYMKGIHDEQMQRKNVIDKYSKPFYQALHDSLYQKSYTTRVLEYIISGKRDSVVRKNQRREQERINEKNMEFSDYLLTRKTFYKVEDQPEGGVKENPKTPTEILKDTSSLAKDISLPAKDSIVSFNEDEAEDWAKNNIAIFDTKELPTIDDSMKTFFYHEKWYNSAYIAELKKSNIRDVYLGVVRRVMARDTYIYALFQIYKNHIANLLTLKTLVDNACDTVNSDTEGDTASLICTQMKLKLADLELKLFNTKLQIVNLATNFERLTIEDMKAYKAFEVEEMSKSRIK